ncbi:MAG: SprT-like domain-containing protein [Vicingaceae bacterium]|nr:SprT-like domain-containing protein [Vicingaceae bacterium]
MITHNFNILKEYVPENSLSVLHKWFDQRPFELKITKKRATKFGDFRASLKGGSPKISVNSNLNQYAFLITLTHEFAHLLVWHNHKHKAKAHGIEWKTEFSKLMQILLQKGIFPEPLKSVLEQHMKNPAASSARDAKLISELKKYDAPSDLIMLSYLPEGTKFTLNGKRIFIKGKKRRTRYFCKEINTKKQYLINGVADVLIVD